MSEAVRVRDAYKKFGSLNPPVFPRVPRLAGYSNGRPNTSKDLFPRQTLIVAVDHVSFTVKQSEIFGILGVDGSGKSTLLRLIAGILHPDGGSIRVFDYDPVRQPVQVQRLTNRASMEAGFFRKRSVMENLLASARQFEVGIGKARRRIVDLLDRLGVSEAEIHAPMETVSRSVQQKAGIALALLGRPQLLLLDEPTNGLDLPDRQSVHAMIRALRDEFGTTVLVTTQDLEEAQVLCDRSVCMDRGKMEKLGGPAPFGLIHAPAAGERQALPDEIFMNRAGQPLVKELSPV